MLDQYGRTGSVAAIRSSAGSGNIIIRQTLNRSAMQKRIETVVIGAGQAGLATSYFLTKQGREHIVLEKASQTADQWRNQRWDSFSLVTPNWALQLPGAAYKGDQPDGFLPRDEM